jgi:hypothetical protein
MVRLHPKHRGVWRVTKVKGLSNVYTIAAADRKSPCNRFIGAASVCARNPTEPAYVRLYNSATGLDGPHYWKIFPFGLNSDNPGGANSDGSDAAASPPPPANAGPAPIPSPSGIAASPSPSSIASSPSVDVSPSPPWSGTFRPYNVAVKPFTDGSNKAVVSWEIPPSIPIAQVPIIGYNATCSTYGGSTTGMIFAPGKTTTSVEVGGMSAADYQCWVFGVNSLMAVEGETSNPSTPVTIGSTGGVKSSPPPPRPPPPSPPPPSPPPPPGVNCNACPAGQYQVQACVLGVSDRVCAACAAACVAGLKYESQPCTATTQRICSTCSTCPGGSHESGGCFGSVDTTCTGGAAVTVLPSPPGSPAVGVTVPLYTWQTTWAELPLSTSSAGYPRSTYKVRCVAFNAACSATAVSESPAIAFGLGAATGAELSGFTTGLDYSCFTVAVHPTLGVVCSTLPTTLYSPPPTYYTIAHPDGRTWKLGALNPSYGNQVKLTDLTLTTLSFSLFTSPTVPQYQSRYLALYSFSKQLHFQSLSQGWMCPNCEGSKFSYTLFKNPAGGYAIQMQTGALVGYNSGGDYLFQDTSTGRIDWVISPDPPAIWIKGTLSLPTAPGSPTATATPFPTPISWQASWTLPGGGLGWPVPNYKLRCVPSGSACTAANPFESNLVASTTTTAMVSGLTMGSTFSCFVVAVNRMGETCSAATTVNVPAGVGTTYTIAHSDGRAWRVGTTGSYGLDIKLNTGNTATYYLYQTASNPSVPRQAEGYGSLYATNRQVNFQDGSQGTHSNSKENGLYSYIVYSNPNGGYAIYMNGGEGISYNSGSDAYAKASAGNEILDFQITPAPTAPWLKGALSLPGVPGDPTATATPFPTPISWQASWTLPGVLGNPTPTYKLYCVPSGGLCTDAGGIASNAVLSTTTTTMVPGLTMGSAYSCFTVAVNRIGQTCSAGSTTVNVPAGVGTTYSIAHSDGRAWRVGTTGSYGLDIKLNTGNTASYYLYQTTSNPSVPRQAEGYGSLYATNRQVNFQDGSQGTHSNSKENGLYSYIVFSNPNGGYAIYMNGGDGISYNSGSDAYAKASAGNEILDFQITPAPTAPWLKGALSAPSMPGNPPAGTFPSPIAWSSTWTEVAPYGFPTPTYRLKCVANGAACTATGIESSAVAPGVMTATVSGLTRGVTYTCFAVGVNRIGSTCSAGSVQVPVPA